MKKFIVIGIIVLGLAWGGLSYYSYRQETQVPSAANAPYQVTTLNRVFYAREVTGDPPNVTMSKYYTKEGKKWVFYEYPLRFNVNFPALSVSDRR